MTIVDAAGRAHAIDPTRSFCVSAPAGSGKTELLIQRYLQLLSRVQAPEQVLAITFTRKAAAEMRARVVEALQGAADGEPCDNSHQQTTRKLAERALAADARGGWHLVRDISRLNIKTIDSFCGGLTRQMPVLSEFGGQANLLDDAGELYAEAVVELFRQVDSEHPVATDLRALMRHFDNNWERLQSLLVAMLARRDQWRGYIGVHHAPDESEAYLRDTVELLVHGELQLLSRALAPYQAQLLDLQQYAARSLGETSPVEFPTCDPGDVASWRALRNLLLTREGTWRKSISVTIGFPPGKGEPQERKDQLKTLIAELAGIEGLEQMLADVNFLPEIVPDSTSWQLLVHLSRLLPVLAAQLLLVFQKHGAVDHSQVTLSALQALGDDESPTELALRLDYQIEHILVDEFQDTAINQYELLRLLTRGWGQHNDVNPEAPRTMMIVGDGMQSIYGFRGANVGLFLKAREQGFNGVCLEHLNLLSNFRSDEGVVDWVNETFAWAFPARDDINRGRVSYTPATAVRPPALAGAVQMHGFHGEFAREQEIALVCKQIAAACADTDCTSVAVLGRSRGHLQPIIAGLKQQAIPYIAADMDSLERSPLVADLLTLCRALANGADRLAWMALLRAPWCALVLADLLKLAAWGESPRDTPVLDALADEALRQSLSTDGRSRVEAVLPVLQQARDKRDRLGLRVWLEQTWLGLSGPAIAPDRAALADAEAFFQLLEQADREGVGLDIEWLERRLARQYMSGGEPGSKVQLMTLHKAKGLEFDCVIIPQLARPTRPDDRELLLWDEHTGPEGDRSFLLAADDHSERGAPTLYNYLDQQRKEKSLLEGTRLLYVGATRAIRQLVLTASLSVDEKKGEFRRPPARCLLSPIWETFAQQMTVHEPEMVQTTTEATATRAKLLRLERPAVPAVQSPPIVAEVATGANIPLRPDNHRERCIGTVVHLALDELSRRSVLPDAVGRSDRQLWRLALARLGLWGEALEASLHAVLLSLDTTLKPGGAGRWILAGDHPHWRSEWALTRLDSTGRIQDLVVDRCFVDGESGIRWIVDYKTSQPDQGEPVEDFFARESAVYREQLQRYREAVSELCGEPIACALYFTVLGHLHHLGELDLPARE